ncbi:hypothetical protein [Peribacillus huizhouensis]|uniref:Uncharacterized protein n=1 Tax=Peribacillus huizhouensis TaxID=1501239 RepID=A0ABR6CWQ0_9BACI|nr:hypothetical protein [Peribacillus huizhouensis]MBA9029113.1 hypothetical protein [Peribacillus huizhouensis]
MKLTDARAEVKFAPTECGSHRRRHEDAAYLVCDSLIRVRTVRLIEAKAKILATVERD